MTALTIYKNATTKINFRQGSNPPVFGSPNVVEVLMTPPGASACVTKVCDTSTSIPFVVLGPSDNLVIGNYRFQLRYTDGSGNKKYSAIRIVEVLASLDG